MIQKVLKKTRRSKGGQICESRSYYLRFRFDPMPKDRWISLKTTDKQVALKKGQELMQEMQQELRVIACQIPPYRRSKHYMSTWKTSCVI